MSTNVEQYSGDESLYCHLGQHAYETSRCKYCGQRKHLIDLSLPNQKRDGHRK